MNRPLKIMLIITVFLFACSKDNDKNPPVIKIISPSDYTEINGIDTLVVRATISDDINIKNVSVSVRGASNVPIGSTVSKAPNTTTYDFNVLYFFENIHTLSGEYEMRISATDGENTTNEFVTILLNETPIVRNGIFVISNSGSTSTINLLDNQYNGSFYTSVSGNFLGAGLNSFNQQLAHASSGANGSEKISAIDLINTSNLWSFPIFGSPPTPTYNGFYFNNRTVYLGKRLGGVIGYNESGIDNFNSQVISNHYMESALEHHNLLITEQHALSSNNVQLIPYYSISGVNANGNATINEDVVGMFTRNQNEIIVFSNDAANNSNLTFYNPNTGSLTAHPLNLGKVDDCVAIAPGVHLVVHNGEVSIVNVNNSFPFATPSLFISGSNANHIWFDAVRNEVFIASGNQLTVYNTSGNQLGSYTHSGTIKEVLFWYNK